MVTVTCNGCGHSAPARVFRAEDEPRARRCPQCHGTDLRVQPPQRGVRRAVHPRGHKKRRS